MTKRKFITSRRREGAAPTTCLSCSSAGKMAPRHLFKRWPHTAGRIRRAWRLALFLDFDGTLVPIDDHPEKVRIGLPTRNALKRLASYPQLKIWIISGRRLADLEKRVRVPGVACLGLHGCERRRRTARLRQTSAVKQARAYLVSRLHPQSRVALEDKSPGFAVHYRHASLSLVRRLSQLILEIEERFKSGISILSGKNVWEIFPFGFEGKGAAVRSVLQQCRQPVLPIYLGDDTSDEAAFAALRRGLTVHVGAGRHTRAHYRLRDPSEVLQFFNRLEDILSCKLQNSLFNLSRSPM